MIATLPMGDDAMGDGTDGERPRPDWASCRGVAETLASALASAFAFTLAFTLALALVTGCPPWRRSASVPATATAVVAPARAVAVPATAVAHLRHPWRRRFLGLLWHQAALLWLPGAPPSLPGGLPGLLPGGLLWLPAAEIYQLFRTVMGSG